MEATNYLIDRACQYEQSNSDDIVLRKELFRIATSAKQAKQLQQTAEEMPYLCDWLEPIDLPLGTTTDANNSHNHASSSGIIHGGLRLRNGCKVIYLPSYLQGLWAACQNFETTGTHNVRWEHKDVTKQSYALLEQYDAVVLAAGSGLFDNEQGPGILSPTSSIHNVHPLNTTLSCRFRWFGVSPSNFE